MLLFKVHRCPCGAEKEGFSMTCLLYNAVDTCHAGIQLHIFMCACTGEVRLTDYSLSTNTSVTAEEVEEWVRSGPSSMTKWVSWQADWRLFDFDFLLEWGGRYGPALHQGQWWRWMTWGTHPLLVPPHAVTAAWVDP